MSSNSSSSQQRDEAREIINQMKQQIDQVIKDYDGRMDQLMSKIDQAKIAQIKNNLQ